MGMKKLDQYRTGMYLRLSSGDDDRDGKGKIDSNSSCMIGVNGLKK